MSEQDERAAASSASFQHHVLCSCLPTTEIGSRGCMCRIEYGASLESGAIEALRKCVLGEDGAMIAAEAVLAKYDSRQKSCPLCGSTRPDFFAGKCADYKERGEPAHIFHWHGKSGQEGK